MDFGQPNVEIGRKMANAQLLFLALKVTGYHFLLNTHAQKLEQKIG